ncbi:hypothetical protein BC827DRAFT_1317943 [Russula dissimulans]|nr:hypothetical protein BC827DRAFT_1317943 [Russula dissimulans]
MYNKKVVIVGGHGQVALRLTRLLSAKQYAISSIIRTEDHVTDLTAISPNVIPFVLNLEDSPISAFTDAFSGADSVVFSAGAGGTGDPDRTRTVDYEGALKVFDAIEAIPGEKPHLLLVSAADVHGPDQIPPHWNEADRAASARTWKILTPYFHWKYKADKNLVHRAAFPWTILRPTALTDAPGTGRTDIGRTHVTASISRDDVALILAELIERADAAGLVIDISGGDVPIAEGLDQFINKGKTDWRG